MNYPRMLFPNGDPTREYRIVADAEEEAGAIAEGYRVAYSAAPKPAQSDDAASARRGKASKAS